MRDGESSSTQTPEAGAFPSEAPVLARALLGGLNDMAIQGRLNAELLLVLFPLLPLFPSHCSRTS